MDNRQTWKHQCYCLLGSNINLTEESWQRVKEGRAVIDKILDSGEVAYGMATGFGLFSKVVVSKDQLHDLQVNLILSHASGVGELLPRSRTRMLMALRVMCQQKVIVAFRSKLCAKFLTHSIRRLSVIPCKGTVGASGDLAPLSHLALGLIGVGDMGTCNGETIGKASDILHKHDLKPIYLRAKEGLAMINGTQLIIIRCGSGSSITTSCYMC